MVKKDGLKQGQFKNMPKPESAKAAEMFIGEYEKYEDAKSNIRLMKKRADEALEKAEEKFAETMKKFPGTSTITVLDNAGVKRRIKIRRINKLEVKVSVA